MQKTGNDPAVMQSDSLSSEDKILLGTGPQKMAVNMFLIEQYAGQSNTK